MRIAPVFLSLALIATICGDASAAAPVAAHDGAVRHHPVRAHKLTTLYDQTGHDSGIAIVSQNFEDDFDTYDTMVADDFAVPEGTRWRIREIEVIGTYFNGIGPAQSLNISIHRNKDGLPGKLVAKYDSIAMVDDNQGSFVVRLPNWLTLKPGGYWISVQANMDFVEGGEWGWETASIVVHDPALFQNPGDGFASGCTTWAPLKSCIDSAQGDMLFALRGKER